MTRVSTIFGFFCNSNPNFRSRPVWSEKKLTTIVQNIFQVLSDSFGLMMQMHSFRTRLNLHTICLLYTYYKFWRHVKIVNRRGMYVYQQDLELFHAMPSLTKESFSQNIWWPSSSVLNANFCLLKTTIITGNLTSLTCHWLFYYYSKEEEKNASSRSYEQFFLQLRS